MTVLTWLGHAGFLLESRGSKLAVDVWRRGPTWSRTDLSGLAVLALSHGHFDHAEDAPDILKETGATGVAIFEVASWLQQNGVPSERAVGVNKGGTWTKDGWTLTMVDAVHSSGCPDGGTLVTGGEAAGWVIRTPDGEVVYHAGDTAVFGDIQLLRRLYRPEVALLPVGGHFTMGPREAALAVELLGVRHVVPMHYGTFPILSGTPRQLQDEVGPGVHVHELQPGGRLDLAALQA
ncbi:MAG TPA: metal-dependent hydrolase [Candidatus Thermoplasmatota archaeon]|nr:metal-dependent hydrolase [Candidatus Thermoplasmatota archaeon]